MSDTTDTTSLLQTQQQPVQRIEIQQSSNTVLWVILWIFVIGPTILGFLVGIPIAIWAATAKKSGSSGTSGSASKGAAAAGSTADVVCADHSSIPPTCKKLSKAQCALHARNGREFNTHEDCEEYRNMFKF